MNIKKYIFQKSFFPFLVCSLAGLILSFFSFSEINFWQKLLEMLNNRWLIVTLFLAISIMINNIYNIFHNDNLLFRSSNLHIHMKKAIYNIIIFIILYMFLFLILLCLFAIIYCKGNFDNVYFSYYTFPMYVYIVFYFVKIILFLILIGIVEFLLRWKINGMAVAIFTTILITFMLFGFDIIISNNIISQINEIPIFITSYFDVKQYSTFKLELFATFMQLLFWTFMIFIAYKLFFINNQEDKMK